MSNVFQKSECSKWNVESWNIAPYMCSACRTFYVNHATWHFLLTPSNLYSSVTFDLVKVKFI
jgi:hypothetical protein